MTRELEESLCPTEAKEDSTNLRDRQLFLVQRLCIPVFCRVDLKGGSGSLVLQSTGSLKARHIDMVSQRSEKEKEMKKRILQLIYSTRSTH